MTFIKIVGYQDIAFFRCGHRANIQTGKRTGTENQAAFISSLKFRCFLEHLICKHELVISETDSLMLKYRVVFNFYLFNSVTSFNFTYCESKAKMCSRSRSEPDM